MKFVASTGYFDDPRAEMVQFVPAECKRVLDLGCGEGNFGVQLKRKMNCEVWGVEIDERAAAAAEGKYDKVVRGDFLALHEGLPAEYFDCAIVNDVVEHFAKPEEVLRKIARLLIPGGKIVFSIPNVRYLENLYELIIHKDWRYREAGILDSGHLRFYTRKSIVRLFTENGFEVNSITGVNKGFSRRLLKFIYLVLNLLTINSCEDTAYLQFAGVATIVDKRKNIR